MEYLVKVAEVKDTVYKHTLLHHLVNMVIDQFPESSDFYSEIGSLSRCAKVICLWCVSTSFFFLFRPMYEIQGNRPMRRRFD